MRARGRVRVRARVRVRVREARRVPASLRPRNMMEESAVTHAISMRSATMAAPKSSPAEI